MAMQWSLSTLLVCCGEDDSQTRVEQQQQQHLHTVKGDVSIDQYKMDIYSLKLFFFG